jgi:tRNA(adenine34) deaminase
MISFDDAMSEALIEARAALETGDVPVGAVIVSPAGNIIGRGRNRREADADPTAHAEVVAIRQAALALGNWRLDGCALVVTLEPCAMCAGAVLQSRIPRIVLGAWDAKAGATGSQWDLVRDARIGSKVEVVAHVREGECAQLLSEFFQQRR